MKRSILFVLCLAIAIAACSDGDSARRLTEHELDLELTDGAWTYVALETGSVVATVDFADAETQAELAQRTDWDVALAPDGLIRTNSGKSGSGAGGVATANSDYESTDPAMPAGLQTDTLMMEIY